MAKLLPYNTSVCPICGNNCKHPETGEITKTKESWQAFLDDDNYCLLMEHCDEGGGCIGYSIGTCRGEKDNETRK